MTLSSILVTAVHWAIGVWFVAATPTTFRQDDRSRRLGLVVAIGIVVALFHMGAMLSAPVPLTRDTLAALTALGGAALFRAASVASRDHGLFLAFSNKEPDGILRRGHYAFVRHPFYAAYILFWAAVCIHAGTLSAFAGCLVLATFYVVAALFEERQIAASCLGAEYRCYMVATGMFVPIPAQLVWH